MPVESPALVEGRSFEFVWNGGFAFSQKQKNVDALHTAARDAGVAPVLEVSTKSRERVGSQLSAFNLTIETSHGSVPVEVAFQASKVYEFGGPYSDMYSLDPRDTRRDPRHRSSGALVGFQFEDDQWSLNTGTLFYDWLYLRALRGLDVENELDRYAGFSDIEFNPKKSLNCQARSCALFVAMAKRELLGDAVRDPNTLKELTVQYVRSTIAGNDSLPSADDGPQLDWSV